MYQVLKKLVGERVSATRKHEAGFYRFCCRLGKVKRSILEGIRYPVWFEKTAGHGTLSIVCTYIGLGERFSWIAASLLV